MFDKVTKKTGINLPFFNNKGDKISINMAMFGPWHGNNATDTRITVAFITRLL